MPECHEIKVRGHLDEHGSEGFAGLTLISGLLSDQAALHGLLERIRNHDLELVAGLLRKSRRIGRIKS